MRTHGEPSTSVAAYAGNPGDWRGPVGSLDNGSRGLAAIHKAGSLLRSNPRGAA
jgi:hypothetical protein